MIAAHARRRILSLFIPLVVLFTWPAFGQADAYHILLTNDDGIESPGIQTLAEELRALGQVHVVAPCGQRSGARMSVALRDDLNLRPIERDGKPLGHCVDTTPAGAVMLAVTKLSPDGGEGRHFRPRIGLETEFPDETDTSALMQDRITITPLQFDWTAYSVLDEVGGWELSHKVTPSAQPERP